MKTVPLYESLANEIALQIEKGVYPPGSRLPSVRKMSKIKKLSINTVKQAYLYLESKCLIKAKQQSGHYIQYKWPQPVIKKDTDWNSINPTLASSTELLHLIHMDQIDSDLIQLGYIELNPQILPVKSLNRIHCSKIRSYQKKCLARPSIQGTEQLRREIARYYAEIGCIFSPDDIYITSGCLEGIFLALLLICKPGDTIVTEQPLFPGSLILWERLGLKVIEIPANPSTGISVEILKYILDKNKVAAAVLGPNFSNPLGSLIPTENKKLITEVFKDLDIPVIEDDTLGDLSFSPERPDLLASHDKTGNVITASSFTKTLAPGYRVGWIVPGKIKKQFEQLKISLDLSASVSPQLAIAEFMASGFYTRHLRRICRTYAVSMSKMASAISEHFPPETRLTHPKGGFILWVELPAACDSLELYKQARQEGITIMPGPVFTTTRKFRNCLRLNSAIWSDKIENAIVTLGKIIVRQLKRH